MADTLSPPCPCALPRGLVVAMLGCIVQRCQALAIVRCKHCTRKHEPGGIRTPSRDLSACNRQQVRAVTIWRVSYRLLLPACTAPFCSTGPPAFADPRILDQHLVRGLSNGSRSTMPKTSTPCPKWKSMGAITLNHQVANQDWDTDDRKFTNSAGRGGSSLVDATTRHP